MWERRSLPEPPQPFVPHPRLNSSDGLCQRLRTDDLLSPFPPAPAGGKDVATKAIPEKTKNNQTAFRTASADGKITHCSPSAIRTGHVPNPHCRGPARGQRPRLIPGVLVPCAGCKLASTTPSPNTIGPRAGAVSRTASGPLGLQTRRILRLCLGGAARPADFARVLACSDLYQSSTVLRSSQARRSRPSVSTSPENP